MNVNDCKIELYFNRTSVYDQIVSVQCQQDPYSQCEQGEHLHGNTCYKIISEDVGTKENAKSLCLEHGGHLLQITSQV